MLDRRTQRPIPGDVVDMRRPASVEFVIKDDKGVTHLVDIVRSGVAHLNYDQVPAGYALAGWLGNMIVHWGVFRGGWTVFVFAADGKTVVRKIRCRNREAARAAGAKLYEQGAAAFAS